MKIILFVAAMVWPWQAAAFCDPPVPPPPTDLEMAKEFRDEFKFEFEQYFQDAQEYLRCIEQERTDVLAEIQNTIDRYNRFLTDSQARK